MGDSNSGGSAVALQHVLTDFRSLNGQSVVKSINGECKTGVNIMTELSDAENHSAGDSEMKELDSNFKMCREEIMEDAVDSSGADLETTQPSKIIKLDMAGDNCNKSSGTNEGVSDSTSEIDKTDTVDGEFIHSLPPCVEEKPLVLNGVSEEDGQIKKKYTVSVNVAMPPENCDSDSGSVIVHENSPDTQSGSNNDFGNGHVADDEQGLSNSNEKCSENGNACNDTETPDIQKSDLSKLENNEDSITPNKTLHTSSEKSHFLIGDKVRSSLQGLLNKVSKLSSSTTTSATGEYEGDMLKALDNVEAVMDDESDINDTHSRQKDKHKSEIGHTDACSEENMDVIELDSSQDEKESSEENEDHTCDTVQSNIDQSEGGTSTGISKQDACTASVTIDSVRLKDNLTNESKESDDILLAPSVDDDILMEIGSDNEDDLLKDGSNTSIAGSRGHEKMDDDSNDIIFEKEVKASDNNSTETETNTSQIQQNENILASSFDQDTANSDKKPSAIEEDDDVIFESETKADKQIITGSAFVEKTKEEKLVDSKIENKDADNDDDDDDVIFESEEKGNSTSANIAPVSVNNDNNTLEKTNHISEQTSKSNDKIMNRNDSDDDIIFEGETKAPEFSSVIKSESADKDNKGIVKTEPIKKHESECKIKSDSESDDKNNSSIKKEVKDETSKVKGSIGKSKADSNDADRCTKLNVDRKRPPSDTKDPSETDSKRSRLDLVIGKLGSAIGIAPDSVEVLDSDKDDEEDDVTDTTAVEKSGESASSEEEEKDESEDEDDSDDDDKTKYIKITEAELDQLVREKVTGYLTTQRDTLIAQLQQKVKDLQISNDNWKAQVKDLQVKINEVTVLQQKHEKRKAATAALRSITSRSVGVQVDDGKTANTEKLIAQRAAAKPASPQVAPTRPLLPVPLISAPPGSGGTIRLPISQVAAGQSALATQLSSPTAVGNMKQARVPSVKSLLDQTRIQPTAIAPASVTTLSIPTTTSVNMVQYPHRFITPNGTQGFIISQAPPQNAIKSPPTKPTPSAASTNLTSPVLKVIDLTADDDSSKAPRVVTLPVPVTASLQQMASSGSTGQQLVFSPTMSSQLVRTSMTQPAYQLVFNSTSPSLRNPPVVSGVATLPQTMVAMQQSTPAATSVVSATRALIPAVVSTATSVPVAVTTLKHPAPFPPLPANQKTAGLKSLPPKPSLKISRVSQGIVLSWNMTVNDGYSEISNYQLFAYQETASAPITTVWKKVGDVKALPLPMACTLTQFQVGNKYHFAVRAMDVHGRVGLFSEPSSIHLTPLVSK